MEAGRIILLRFPESYVSDSPSSIHGPLLLSTFHIFSRCSFIPPARLLSLLFPLTHSHLKLGWPLISPQACPTHSSSSLQDYSSCQAVLCRKPRLVPCSCPDASRTQLLLASVAVFWRGFPSSPGISARASRLLDLSTCVASAWEAARWNVVL